VDRVDPYLSFRRHRFVGHRPQLDVTVTTTWAADHRTPHRPDGVGGRGIDQRSGESTVSEVDDISQGLGKEMRGLFAAALALAQLAAQRRAAQVREQAAATGVAEQEARRRFELEQRVAALGIPLPEAGMTPEQVAQAWAQADVARAHAPEVAEFWDGQARAVGVDPDQVRAQWWAEHDQTREDPGVYRVAVAGLGVEGAGAVTDADRALAEDLQAAAGRERRDGQDEIREHHGAEADVDRADNLGARASDLEATAAHEVDTDVGDGASPTSLGAWQQGHPSARLAGKAYGVAPGRGVAPARRRSRSGGAGMAAAKQREHGLDR